MRNRETDALILGSIGMENQSYSRDQSQAYSQRSVRAVGIIRK